MSERTVLSFTFENMLTVCLMVFVGFAIYGVLARTVYKVAHRGE